MFIQIEADYKNVPEFKVKLFFGFLKCSIFNYVFKKRVYTCTHGKVHSTDPKSNPEHSEHFDLNIMRTRNPEKIIRMKIFNVVN